MKTKTILGTLLMLTAVFSAFAQENEKRFAVELNGGFAVPMSEIDGEKLNPGFGFEGLFHYRFMPHVGAYAGWGWNQLNADNSFAGADTDFEETGYILGLQYQNNLGKSPVGWFVRGGGLYNHIETENSDGDIVNDSGHGFGWQAAAGIDVPLGKNWSLTPGVKFNSLSRDTEFESVTKQLDYKYLSFRVGIVKRF